jgi:hypothetical protein
VAEVLPTLGLVVVISRTFVPEDGEAAKSWWI